MFQIPFPDGALGLEHLAAIAAMFRFMHPNGQFPAYEWNFNDVNPPVHAWWPSSCQQERGRRDNRRTTLPLLVSKNEYMVASLSSLSIEVRVGLSKGRENFEPCNILARARNTFILLGKSTFFSAR